MVVRLILLMETLKKSKYKKKSSDIDTRPFYLMVFFQKTASV